MVELVDPDQIEGIVGFRRHGSMHIARAVSATENVFILHSRDCLERGIDLRDCEYSKALEHGISLPDGWAQLQDQPVAVRVTNGRLRATRLANYFTRTQYDAMLVRDQDDDR
jgi:hypothetical protein